MAYTVTQAPAGGTQVNQYAGGTDAQKEADNEWQRQYSAANPTGYADNRSFMNADSSGYWDYQSKRMQAYNQWRGSQTQTPTQTQAAATPNGTGANMPIIQSAMSPGGVNRVAAAQTQGYPSGQVQTMQAPAQAQTMQATQAQPQTMQATQASQSTPGGIINRNLTNYVDAEGQITGVDSYNAAQLGDPTLRNVASEQTMQGQLGQILSKDGMLMQMAQARALEQMNERGLGNSSLAIGAGQRAVAEVAMPIAQNDAGVYERADTYNVDAKNQFAVQNVGWQNQALQFNAGEANVANRQNSQNRTQTNIENKRNETTRWTAQLDADTKMDLGRMDSDTRRYIADQDVGVRRELGYLDATVRREDIGMRRDLGMADIGVRRELGYLENDTKRYGIDVNAAVQREGFQVERELGYLDANTRTNIANMSNATQISVAQMGHEYAAQLQASESASAQFRQMSANIAEIDMSNLSTQGKKYAIERQMMQTRDILGVLGDVGSIPNMGYYYRGGYV